jgi:ribosomal protein S4E
LNRREVTLILNDKEGNIFVDGKVRRDIGFPTGLMGNKIYIKKRLIFFYI